MNIASAAFTILIESLNLLENSACLRFSRTNRNHNTWDISARSRHIFSVAISRINSATPYTYRLTTLRNTTRKIMFYKFRIAIRPYLRTQNVRCGVCNAADDHCSVFVFLSEKREGWRVWDEHRKWTANRPQIVHIDVSDIISGDIHLLT